MSTTGEIPAPRLTRRQALVLRAVVASYVGDATPVASERVAHLLPVALSPASVRNTLAELAELGVVEKPHASAGRVPTELGLRVYVTLLEPRDLGRYERRDLEGSLEDALPGGVTRAASRLLSERTRQLGFVVPRPDHAVLRSLSLVRLTRDHILAVLVSRGGAHSRRVLPFPGVEDERELEQIAAALSERVAGRTLRQARERMAFEAAALRSHADGLLERALRLGLEAVAPGGMSGGEDVVIATRLALLDQPEFRDPDRIRQLFEALETQERLLAILDGLLEADGVRVTFGNDLDEPGLRHCVLVAAPYGDAGSPIGVLGVIGPSRMDYARIIPLVDCLSELLTERLGL